MTRDEWLRQEIQNYRKKIETYQTIVAEFEQQLGGLSTNGSGSPAVATGASNRQDVAPGEDPIGWISGMIFFNKTQTQAAKMILEKVGYPLSTVLLLSGVERGGLKVGGKTDIAKKQNLYTILNRNPEFGRVKRDTWGLVGWPGVTKKSDDDADQDAPAKKAEKVSEG
jgi:hypothetical protein